MDSIGERSLVSASRYARHRGVSEMRRSNAPLTTFQSEYLTYRALWHAARQMHDNGEKDDAHGFWSILAAALFIYTAYEGFVNDLGDRIALAEWSKEKEFFSTPPYIGTMGKTQFLAKHVGLRLIRRQRPYSTLAELHAWRNNLVHPRTVRLQGSRRIAADRKPPAAYPSPFKTLERPAFVGRCFEDVAALADQLLAAAASGFRDQVHDYGSNAFVGVLGSRSASVR
jgi:hypothetical protein